MVIIQDVLGVSKWVVAVIEKVLKEKKEKRKEEEIKEYSS